MQYQTFLTYIQKQLTEHLNEQANLSFFPILKNNGSYLDAICFTSPNQTVSPILYINDFYQKYQSGQSLESILQEIITLFTAYQSTSMPPFSQYLDFDYAKSHIVYRLIHTEMNQALLQQIPHIPYLDLSIVFYLYIGTKDSCSPMSSLIYNTHQALWGCSTEELYTLAKTNSPRLLSPTFSCLHTILNQLIKEHHKDPDDLDDLDGLDDLNNLDNLDDLEDTFNTPINIEDTPFSPSSPIYVLSNCQNFYGASSILYPNVLKKFADTLEKDFVLIPSSIHEFLVLPMDNSLPLPELNHMVVSVNQSSVSMEERLSDHVYYYSRETDQISIPLLFPSSLT